MAAAVAALTLVAVLAAGVGAFALLHQRIGDLRSIPDVFAGLDEATRPAAPGPGAGGGRPVTFLLVGTDTRADGATTGTAATEAGADARADTIMLARFKGGGEVSVVGIPRDSWVEVPGHGKNKINAAYAFGGPSLLVRTVEQLTNVRVDHFAVVDFAGFAAVTDAIGGVEVQVDTPSSNLGHTFQRGRQLMNGEQALAFVRQRHGLPGGDFDRIQRQQAYLLGVVRTLGEKRIWTNPGAVGDLVDAATRSISVDDSLGTAGLLALAAQARTVRGDRVAFSLAPVAGVGMEGAQSVVYLDLDATERLGDRL